MPCSSLPKLVDLITLINHYYPQSYSMCVLKIHEKRYSITIDGTKNVQTLDLSSKSVLCYTILFCPHEQGKREIYRFSTMSL